MLGNLLGAGRDKMFRINVQVEYQGKSYTAVYWDGSTRSYQLRGDDNSLVWAAESDLMVI